MDQIYDAADLGVHLAALRERRGSPPYRLMEKRAESTEALFGRLPRSTAQRIAAREATPSLHQMQAYLVSCGIPVAQHGPYVQAWQRVAARIGGSAGARFQRELDMSAQDQAVSKLVRTLGYTPAEKIRVIGRPLTVTCDACGALRRIRLDKTIKQLSLGDVVRMSCPNCGTTQLAAPDVIRRKSADSLSDTKYRASAELWGRYADAPPRASSPSPAPRPGSFVLPQSPLVEGMEA
ncbi:hypothetical protein [Streptomyces sp. bgisy091]|uniref:hypothetical protein n=1 Tax=Streptomyces sp. bgisy091 TaxID=3413778 RepID=UPI003D71C52C